MSKLIAKHRRLTSAVISVSTAILLTGTALVPVASAALTEAQIQSILSLLQSFGADQAVVDNVNLSLRGQATSGTVSTAGKCSFTRALTVGVTGDDVKCLQQYLNGAGFAVASSGAGSAGNESTYFGSLSQSAVAKWQAANGVSLLWLYFNG
ncbi:MAG: peptidoglycan-binding protein [Candidatus Niyogibacteria bacterium]|nr:peptidoglycan-binding protein [Candidatus Niyogibacteria bacterium]